MGVSLCVLDATKFSPAVASNTKVCKGPMFYAPNTCNMVNLALSNHVSGGGGG